MLTAVYHIYWTIRHSQKILIFSKIESVSYNAVQLMYESGCAFSPRTNYMW